jgi:hypothetical protein
MGGRHGDGGVDGEGFWPNSISEPRDAAAWSYPSIVLRPLSYAYGRHLATLTKRRLSRRVHQQETTVGDARPAPCLAQEF